MLTVLSDVLSVEAGVEDGHQAAAPHLALHHVQQEAELAVLAPGVAAAPPGHRLSNVESRLAGPRGRGSGRVPASPLQWTGSLLSGSGG